MINVKNYIKNYLTKCLLSYYILKVQDIKTHLQILIKHMLMMLNMLIVYYIITYYTILIRLKKIERTLSEHNKHILTSLNKKYSDNRVKLNEFKKVNDKLNLLLECICLFMFNKKIKKESIVENVNVLNNINEHTALIDNKRVCLGDILEYLYENINDIHANTKKERL